MKQKRKKNRLCVIEKVRGKEKESVLRVVSESRRDKNVMLLRE